ncbi:MAG TPA: mandelate racemase/muconate lactonizing enzyme family protein [Chloroflexota bacterium]|jgi:D-galactarolactone cycloisomerase|nr:mandelate racemase/muconate lactonizing enzyme family protein [Chloroflexota bacterium]
MKITQVVTHALRAQLRNPFSYSQGSYAHRDAVLVEVRTDEGLTGWGQCSGSVDLVPRGVERHYAPRLIGQDPRDWQRLWHVLGGLSGGHYGIISGLDTALLDLAGKAAGCPVSRLLGGAFRSRVQVYATGLYRLARWESLDAWREGLIEEALGYRAQGFRTTKLKIGFVPREDVSLVHAVRAAIGPQMGLAVDANCAWDVATATWVGRRVADADLAWYEEPLPAGDLQGYREVRRALSVPLSGGESLAGLHPFGELLAARAVDIVQPDIVICGGFSMLQRVQSLADTARVRLVPHCWGTAIAFAATLQYLATVPDGAPSLTPTEPLLEYDRSDNPLREELLTRPLHREGSYLSVPPGDGLGVEVDPEALERFRIRE